MTRIGIMIKSAKMKLITPPKLMPPFHSTAASGTFPIEQTKLKTETSGPISGHPVLSKIWVAGEEEVLPEAVGYPGRDRARDEQAADDVPDHRRPFHDKDV